MKHISLIALALSVAGCAHVPAASNQSAPFIPGADAVLDGLGVFRG
jgi:hypothetical protein